MNNTSLVGLAITAGAAFLGALVPALVNHFREKRRINTERQTAIHSISYPDRRDAYVEYIRSLTAAIHVVTVGEAELFLRNRLPDDVRQSLSDTYGKLGEASAHFDLFAPHLMRSKKEEVGRLVAGMHLRLMIPVNGVFNTSGLEDDWNKAYELQRALIDDIRVDLVPSELMKGSTNQGGLQRPMPG